MKRTPPRLHVIPASGCDKALILRRGPNDRVAALLWDRASGHIELGQWLIGRIYEHRCDLSPDGRHMVIFARKKDASLAWTAVSRAPWLTALAWYPQDSTWLGGGAFDAEGRLWLNGASAAKERLPEGLRAAPDNAFPHATDGFHMGGLYAAAMAMRGWTHVSGEGYEIRLQKSVSAEWLLDLTIKVQAKNRGILSNGYAVLNAETGQRLDYPAWEWAEPFGCGLQVASEGTLRRLVLSPRGQWVEDRLIHDFTDMAFEARQAPYEGIRQEVHSR